MHDVGGLRAVLIAERALLLRLLRARVYPPEDAEDLWQELWIKAADMASGPIADPLAFLCRAAMNMASDRRRSRYRAVARDEAWQLLQPGSIDQPDLPRELAARDELRRVETAIADMPERTREALRLFRLEGLNQRDIAQQMGISVSGVEKLLKRGYRLLDALREISGAEIAGPQRLPDEGASIDG